MATTDASTPTEASNVDARLPGQHELAMPPRSSLISALQGAAPQLVDLTDDSRRPVQDRAVSLTFLRAWLAALRLEVDDVAGLNSYNAIGDKALGSEEWLATWPIPPEVTEPWTIRSLAGQTTLMSLCETLIAAAGATGENALTRDETSSTSTSHWRQRFADFLLILAARSCAESLAFCISSLVVRVPNEMSPGRPFARRVVAERC